MSGNKKTDGKMRIRAFPVRMPLLMKYCMISLTNCCALFRFKWTPVMLRTY